MMLHSEHYRTVMFTWSYNCNEWISLQKNTCYLHGCLTCSFGRSYWLMIIHRVGVVWVWLCWLHIELQPQLGADRNGRLSMSICTFYLLTMLLTHYPMSSSLSLPISSAYADVCIMLCLKFWADCYRLNYTHPHLQLMKWGGCIASSCVHHCYIDDEVDSLTLWAAAVTRLCYLQNIIVGIFVQSCWQEYRSIVHFFLLQLSNNESLRELQFSL